MGSTKPVNYLLLFQNDKEIRATGGFITSFGFLSITNGQLGPISSSNIYTLDTLYKKVVSPPAALAEYNAATQWYMRDANISPDLPTSVGYINSFYNDTPTMPHIDGMIFVDTQFVANLLKVLGPQTVSQYADTLKTANDWCRDKLPAGAVPEGNVTVTSDNAACLMEYYSEVAEVNLSQAKRKSFLSYLMKSMVDDVLNASTANIIPLITQGKDTLTQKHLQLYFNDTSVENYVLSQNWGGQIVKNNTGDYLNVVEENLGGSKANFYIQRTINQNIQQDSKGNYTDTVSIKYTNPQIYDYNVANSLSAPYKAWFRLYAPLGSKLISMTGFNGSQVITNDTDLNKTIFDNHIDVPVRHYSYEPAATLTVTIKYMLPKGIIRGTGYSELVQKQAGMNSNTYNVTFNGKTFSQILSTDFTVNL